MFLPKLKKTCNFIQLGIISKKKKIILQNNTKNLDSFFKVLCFEGLLQTFTRFSGNLVVLYPRYNHEGSSLFSDIKFIPKSKQIYSVKNCSKQKYTKHLGEIFIFFNKKNFFSFNKNIKQGGQHLITIK